MTRRTLALLLALAAVMGPISGQGTPRGFGGIDVNHTLGAQSGWLLQDLGSTTLTWVQRSPHQKPDVTTTVPFDSPGQGLYLGNGSFLLCGWDSATSKSWLVRVQIASTPARTLTVVEQVTYPQITDPVDMVYHAGEQRLYVLDWLGHAVLYNGYVAGNPLPAVGTWSTALAGNTYAGLMDEDPIRDLRLSSDGQGVTLGPTAGCEWLDVARVKVWHDQVLGWQLVIQPLPPGPHQREVSASGALVAGRSYRIEDGAGQGYTAGRPFEPQARHGAATAADGVAMEPLKMRIEDLVVGNQDFRVAGGLRADPASTASLPDILWVEINPVGSPVTQIGGVTVLQRVDIQVTQGPWALQDGLWRPVVFHVPIDDDPTWSGVAVYFQLVSLSPSNNVLVSDVLGGVIAGAGGDAGGDPKDVLLAYWRTKYPQSASPANWALLRYLRSKLIGGR